MMIDRTIVKSQVRHDSHILEVATSLAEPGFVRPISTDTDDTKEPTKAFQDAKHHQPAVTSDFNRIK